MEEAPSQPALAEVPVAQSGGNLRITTRGDGGRSLLTKTLSPLSKWDDYFDAQNKSSAQRRDSLLRHFQYRTAPWMTAAEPTGRFATLMMERGQQLDAIQSLVIEVASCQNLRRTDPAVVAEASRHLSGARGEAALIGESLVDLVDFLHSSPLSWKTPKLRYLKAMATDGRILCSVDEPLQTLCRVQSKIGQEIRFVKAVCLFNR